MVQTVLKLAIGQILCYHGDGITMLVIGQFVCCHGDMTITHSATVASGADFRLYTHLSFLLSRFVFHILHCLAFWRFRLQLTFAFPLDNYGFFQSDIPMF